MVLHAKITPLLAYALFDPSRILVLGPDSALAAVILGVVIPLSGGDPLRAATVAGMMAFNVSALNTHTPIDVCLARLLPWRYRGDRACG